MNFFDKTILFVTCVTNENLYQLCLKHIRKLKIPSSFTIEFLSLKNVNSMASGYNQALQNKAKYKIYLHQDTFITEKNFLIYLVDLFDRYKEVGLIGLAGCKKVPLTGIWWDGEGLVGKVIDCRFKEPYLLDFDKNATEFIGDLEIVQAIDGFLMATQYDIRWKEEWFDGFHFYDTSQSLEFKKNGYLIGVPFQQTAWSKHGENFKGDYQLDYVEYERNRQVFVNKYQKNI